MRTFNFTLLAMFSYIAMIGATPLRVEAVGRRSHLPDCVEYPNAQVCNACDDDPYQVICDDLCVLNPESSFCSTICETFPDLTFCQSD